MDRVLYVLCNPDFYLAIAVVFFFAYIMAMGVLAFFEYIRDVSPDVVLLYDEPKVGDAVYDILHRRVVTYCGNHEDFYAELYSVVVWVEDNRIHVDYLNPCCIYKIRLEQE